VRLSLRGWGAKHLLIAWSGYWLALGVATLEPALAALWRLSRAGAHGQASAAVGDGLLRLTITSTDGSAWTGAIHFSSLVLWVVGPPLVLWLLWALSRPRRDVAANLPASDASPYLLNDAPPIPTSLERDEVPEARRRRDHRP
jgi:hypothetical protein